MFGTINALKLKLRARTGTLEERIATIDRALQKTEDALTARPESYDGTKLLAELYFDRALMMDGVESVAPLEQAARARQLQTGLSDCYRAQQTWKYVLQSRGRHQYLRQSG